MQAKLPLVGLSDALLGPALFVMGLGAAFGMTFTGNPYIMVIGGFVGSFADDFLEVRTDIILNDMIPSEQRATLISVNSFTFSIVMIFMSTFMGSIM